MTKFEKAKEEVTSKVAWKLLDGPEFLKPFYKQDGAGWLEPVLLIRDYPDSQGPGPSSYSIYVDNTRNRTSNYLSPIARYAQWDRDNDIEKARNKRQPAIDVSQHEISEIEKQNVHNLLVELDKSLSDIHFVAEGLITDEGSFVSPEISPGFSSISFRRTNFNQSIEFDFGGGMNYNREIQENVMNLINYIKKLCRKPMEKNYREAYKTNPFSQFENEGEWYFRPQSIMNKNGK